MKQHILITKNGKTLYEGRISDIPIKEEYLIKKSVDLFDDDDPCIIHQSYVIKEYVDEVLKIFKAINNKQLSVKEHLNELSFLDFMELEKLVISLKE
ncbi:hypothetical protein KQ51_01791 [Candidatus Izimaplasma bacterium HR1]|uniref:hypothetical protein n=1 Tax=Candidatus Izimoplasma sp. HR1 TaxID=1541959 RepID=UPI0004F63488|nr:hypothetical protein KQ51_01791 [Candidatus Izimaplasma bacterium HR1]